MLPVYRLSDFKVHSEKPWILIGVITGIVLMALGLSSYLFGYFLTPIYSALIFGLGASAIIYGMENHVTQEKKRKKKYHAYCDYIDDVSLLSKAVSSDELDNSTKECIKEYLSTNHPGWSFKYSKGG